MKANSGYPYRSPVLNTRIYSAVPKGKNPMDKKADRKLAEGLADGSVDLGGMKLTWWERGLRALNIWGGK